MDQKVRRGERETTKTKLVVDCDLEFTQALVFDIVVLLPGCLCQRLKNRIVNSLISY